MKNVRFIGLDVHAETIAVGVAEPGGEVRSLGTIPNRPSLRKLEKDDYSDDAAKERGTNFTVTVIGFRDRLANTWDFYYQRQLSNTVPKPTGRGSIVQNILEDRLVRIA
jgi:hypothetical protein